jgi:NADH pyrophosphatase NudC (nudix superfamily)
LKEEAGLTLHQDYICSKKYKAAEYFVYQLDNEYRTFPQDLQEIEETGWFTYEEICSLRKNIDVSLFCQHIQKKIIPSLDNQILDCDADIIT